MKDEKEIARELALLYGEYKMKNLTKKEEKEIEYMRTDHFLLKCHKEFMSVYTFMKKISDDVLGHEK